MDGSEYVGYILYKTHCILAAHRCGQVCHGDILLAVNDVSVRFKTITDVVSTGCK